LFSRFGFEFLRDAREVTSWGILFKKSKNVNEI
jgi:hypothetical protein